MESRVERAVFLLTLFLLVGAFAAGQIASGGTSVTGFAVSDAWQFEEGMGVFEILDEVFESLGEQTLGFIGLFLVVFIGMWYASRIFAKGRESDLGITGDTSNQVQVWLSAAVAFVTSVSVVFFSDINPLPYLTYVGIALLPKPAL